MKSTTYIFHNVRCEHKLKYVIVVTFWLAVIIMPRISAFSMNQGKFIFAALFLIFFAFVIVICYPAVNKSTEMRLDLSQVSVSVQTLLLKQIKELNEKVISPLKDRINQLEKGNKHPRVDYLAEKDRKRILVTGGAGFVGCHLVDALLLAGHEVTVVDNFFTGRKSNLEHWIGHENFELINHDVVEPLYIEVDQIYHLASPASPPHYMYNPIKTIKTNSIGTLNMLGLAKRVHARMLLASTSEIYGDPEVHPQPETYWGHVNTIGPRSCYDEGKRVAETMCYAYAKQEGVEVRVARIFNTYGPRMHMNDGRVVSNFILQALQNQPVTIYGTGKQTRSFQYVSDLVNGLILLMNSNISLPVNIGNPEEHSIEEFAHLIIKYVGSTSKVVYLEKAEDDPQRRRPDITRAYQNVGWKPIVPLGIGLNKTIEYFAKELLKSKNVKRKDL